MWHCVDEILRQQGVLHRVVKTISLALNGGRFLNTQIIRILVLNNFIDLQFTSQTPKCSRNSEIAIGNPGGRFRPQCSGGN